MPAQLTVKESAVLAAVQAGRQGIMSIRDAVAARNSISLTRRAVIQIYASLRRKGVL